MTARQPIQPAYGQGQTVSPGAGSASMTIPNGTKQVTLTNIGTNPCYVRITNYASAATTADYPVPSGAQVVVTRNDMDTNLAHISPLGTTLHVIPSEGF